ncbi:MAG: hypothetical protein WBA74_06355 [Cyclobacteriaceae bacterium]
MRKTELKKIALAVCMALLVVGCMDRDLETTPGNNGLDENSVMAEDQAWKEIGYIQNGETVLTFNKSKTLKNYAKSMKSLAGIEANFTDAYLVEYEDSYNLVFKGDDVISTFYVTISDNNKLMVASKTSCTTSDCASEARGCRVMYDNDDLGLSYCSECSNGGKCTKTSTEGDEVISVND